MEFFKIELTVIGYAIENKNKIVRVAQSQNYSKRRIRDDRLPPGLYFIGEENESEPACLRKRLKAVCAAIWKANGGYCKLEVEVFHLDEDCWDAFYQPTKASYAKYIAAAAKGEEEEEEEEEEGEEGEEGEGEEEGAEW